jgi:ribosome-binding factor A
MMNENQSRRAVRVAERIREEMMGLLLRGAVRDPQVDGVYVSSVTVSKDLRHARVYVRLTDGRGNEKKRRDAVKALDRARGYLKRELASVLELRHVPELRFYWDELPDAASRIETLLAEIRDEKSDG